MAGTGSPHGLSVDVRFEGANDLIRKLRRVTDRMTSESTIRAAIRKGAEPIRRAAAARAPVGTESVTRKRLHEGIVIREADESKGTWEQVAPLREVSHANLQEFGTVHHPAQPFMRPAYDEKRGEAVEIVRSELRRAIEEVAR